MILYIISISYIKFFIHLYSMSKIFFVCFVVVRNYLLSTVCSNILVSWQQDFEVLMQNCKGSFVGVNPWGVDVCGRDSWRQQVLQDLLVFLYCFG